MNGNAVAMMHAAQVPQARRILAASCWVCIGDTAYDSRSQARKRSPTGSSLKRLQNNSTQGKEVVDGPVHESSGSKR